MAIITVVNLEHSMAWNPGVPVLGIGHSLSPMDTKVNTDIFVTIN